MLWLMRLTDCLRGHRDCRVKRCGLANRRHEDHLHGVSRDRDHSCGHLLEEVEQAVAMRSAERVDIGQTFVGTALFKVNGAHLE
jgi:hypothetical protein